MAAAVVVALEETQILLVVKQGEQAATLILRPLVVLVVLLAVLVVLAAMEMLEVMAVAVVAAVLQLAQDLLVERVGLVEPEQNTQ
jgi:hypothetical protein